MKKIAKTTKSVQIDAPVVLTPSQIAEIAAGMVVRGGGTTTSGIIKAAQ